METVSQVVQIVDLGENVLDEEVLVTKNALLVGRRLKPNQALMFIKPWDRSEFSTMQTVGKLTIRARGTCLRDGAFQKAFLEEG